MSLFFRMHDMQFSRIFSFLDPLLLPGSRTPGPSRVLRINLASCVSVDDDELMTPLVRAHDQSIFSCMNCSSKVSKPTYGFHIKMLKENHFQIRRIIRSIIPNIIKCPYQMNSCFDVPDILFSNVKISRSSAHVVTNHGRMKNVQKKILVIIKHKYSPRRIFARCLP